MEDFNLNLDNILEGDTFGLFEPESSEKNSEESVEEQTEEKEETQEENVAEVNVEELFSSPESVGNGDNKGEENPSSEKEGGSSNNFYSSIAKSFMEDGIFPDLDEEKIKSISSADDFKAIVEECINNSLDEQQKRVAEALNAQGSVDKIQFFENRLKSLENITDDKLTDETEEGEKLRKALLFVDYTNKGFSKERALKEVEKSFSNGNDISDAKEALKDVIDAVKNDYDDYREELKEQMEEEKRQRVKNIQNLKTMIDKDELPLFKSVKTNDTLKKKIFDNLTSPIYKDSEGRSITAMQKAELEDPLKFKANMGLLFTLTDGFKNVEKILKPSVNAELKKGIRELENRINNTQRMSDGSIDFASGVSEDSYFGKGLKLNI